MTPDPRFPAPVVSLEVDGVRVRADVLSMLKQIQVDQIWDGSDQLTISARAWDEHEARFSIVGEQIFAPGRSVVVRAGDGTADHVVGRFTLMPHSVSLGSGLAAGDVTITGHDGLARMMEGQDPRNMQTAGYYTEAAESVASEYGMGIVADNGLAIPKEARSRRNRKGETREVAPSIRKRAGDTDLRFLKLMAAHNGFESPKVRYLEPNSPLIEVYRQNHDRVVQSSNLGAGLAGGDVLLFRRFNIRRQAQAEAGPWVFRHHTDELVPASLTSFSATWNSARPTLAVRVTGMTPDGRVETVEARLRDRASLLSGDTSPVVIEQVDTRRARAEDRKRFKDHGAVVVETLGEQKPVKRYNPQTKRREEVIGRDVIRETVEVASVGSLRDYAEAYLLGRIGLFVQGSATIENQPGSHRLYPNQAHRFEGVPGPYVGWYRTLTASHIWIPNAARHSVSTNIEKLSDVDPTITAEAVRS